jgi:DNA-binding IclR family transcriptional regulator
MAGERAPKTEDAANGGVVPIQSVQRAAEFLRLFSAQETELTLGEITQRLNLSRATAHRYGLTLRGTGLIRYDPARGVYGLGPRIIELGTAALNSLAIVKIAGPHLERLSATTNETAVMTIWDGEAPVVVQVSDHTDRLVSLSVRVGSRLPVWASAQGMIYLALSGSARRVHAGERLTALEPELAKIREHGFSVSDGVIEGITVVAAAVRVGDEVAGTLALVGTQAGLSGRAASRAAAVVRDIAGELAAELGQGDRG